jgi:hypothetical protein
MAILDSHKLQEFEGDIICGTVLSSTLIDLRASFRNLCQNFVSVKCYNTMMKGFTFSNNVLHVPPPEWLCMSHVAG